MNNVTRVPVSVIVTTYNEEQNLSACLETVAEWADETFVVDSFSTDQTQEIAAQFPVRFVQHEYDSASAQWEWALKNLPVRNEWIFAVDADFRVTSELRDTLADAIPRLNPSVEGLYVRHRQIFRGRFIKHGGIYPRYWLRLFRREAGRVDPNELVDQHYYVAGETRRIEFDVVEDNAKERDLNFWIGKQLRFAERAAIEEIKRRRWILVSPAHPSLTGTPDQQTLWLKSKWYRLPLYWRSVAYFLYRYVVRLGFLDGKEGFLYHFTQCLLYRLAVDTFVDDLLRANLTDEQLTRRLKPIGRAGAT
jgi:glycosyltransferase involved in cell wall biosynthesis